MDKQDWQKSWETRFQEFEAQAAYNQPIDPGFVDGDEYDGLVSGNGTATFESDLGNMVAAVVRLRPRKLTFRGRVLLRVARVVVWFKRHFTREGRLQAQLDRELGKLVNELSKLLKK